jgi:hypothetical protein
VFDAAVGEPGLAAAADAARAIGELARVTKPMGAVVLLQLSWSSELSAEARGLLVERLGVRPRLDRRVEADAARRRRGGPAGAGLDRRRRRRGPPTRRRTSRGSRRRRSSPGVAPLGWKGARAALEREESLLRELSRERSIGFQVIRGVKWPHARGA